MTSASPLRGLPSAILTSDAPGVTADEALASVRSLCVELVEGGRPPYDVGRDIWGIAFAHANEARSLWGHWVLWGSLTDWVEVEPTSIEQAQWRERAGGPEKAMRDAAQGWLDVEASQTGRDDYFEHWLYEVIGHQRPEYVPPTTP
jgi:hypothetical protein